MPGAYVSPIGRRFDPRAARSIRQLLHDHLRVVPFRSWRVGDGEEDGPTAGEHLRQQVLQLAFLGVWLRHTLRCSASSAYAPQPLALERIHDRSIVTPIGAGHLTS